MTLNQQASPPFRPKQHTRCFVRWETLLSYHGNGSTVAFLGTHTRWGKPEGKGGER